MCACSFVSHSAAALTVAHQAHLFIAFPRQEYWRGLPFPAPGDLPDPAFKRTPLASPAFAGGFSATGKRRFSTSEALKRSQDMQMKPLLWSESKGIFQKPWKSKPLINRPFLRKDDIYHYFLKNYSLLTRLRKKKISCII